MLGRTLGRPFRESGLTWNGCRSCLLLSFDCDFPEDCQALPGVVAALGRHKLAASFACIGRWVQDYPDEHRAVTEAGHEVLNHTWSHPELVNAPGRFVSHRSDLNPREWPELSAEEQRQEVALCHEVVEKVLSYQMRGFRAPHFGKVSAEAVYPWLEELGLAYSSSVLATRGRRFGMPVWEGKILEIPVTTCPQHPHSSFDSWHAFYARGGWHRDDFAEVLVGRLEAAVEFGGLTNIYLDPKDVERLDLGRVLTWVAEAGDRCWAPTYSEFTDWYRGQATSP
ncbi:polysaccharide deacetylase family protein [Candidatus Latescibacterota bacterium]